MEDIPILTMTKSRIIGDQPNLIPKSEGLLDTLSGLCSFHTTDDLASFLFTKMFRELVGDGEPWIIFEIGVYKDHTKTLELIPVHDGITLADGFMTGGIQGNISIVKSESDCSQALLNWHNHVMSE
ncbi:MAG: hypothetical protein VXX17_01890 [Candidatus Thermoplasmatota archaeon]|nr:hypothetical protein [Candidatus Thermoplasmatota archaeon]